MNRVLLIVLLVLFVKLLPAQEYFTQGASPDLYLTHQVASKETWFALGRTYNLSPKQIASYNKLNIDTPLEIGQMIKIPLTSANFSQDDNRPGTAVPVFHVVQDKEWMYRISVNHNKVPIERLEKWNGITRDEAKAGMKLIVGYLKVNETGTAANAGTTAAPQATPQTSRNEQPARPAQPQAQTQTGTTSVNTSPVAGNGGYFRSQFTGQGRTQSAVAGVFKSTSGWNDGKYYALMDNVTVGTIIRILLPQTNKTVYAKVLGELPEMKESAGLALRISDAAAKELGATNNKFSVDVAF